MNERAVAGKGKVLVMDDQSVIREVVGQILTHLGYQIELAGNGTEAIELYQNAQQAGVPFDAVIMDLSVPGGMGGKEALKKLLEIDPSVKAIASSGYSTDPIMANYQQHGFRAVVIKPYKSEELHQTLRRVIDGTDEISAQS
ncbi:MAG: response regulator [Acidobacteriota bacterium]